jgi:hypothetical protein
MRVHAANVLDQKDRRSCDSFVKTRLSADRKSWRFV